MKIKLPILYLPHYKHLKSNDNWVFYFISHIFLKFRIIHLGREAENQLVAKPNLLVTDVTATVDSELWTAMTSFHNLLPIKCNQAKR